MFNFRALPYCDGEATRIAPNKSDHAGPGTADGSIVITSDLEAG
jgi:hypothetical protein